MQGFQAGASQGQESSSQGEPDTPPGGSKHGLGHTSAESGQGAEAWETLLRSSMHRQGPRDSAVRSGARSSAAASCCCLHAGMNQLTGWAEHRTGFCICSCGSQLSCERLGF